MLFSEFAQLLRPVIGGSMGAGDFVQTLFSNIVTNEGDAIVEETANSTYRAYYNGTNQITRMAQKIGPYLETENFASYISTFSDETAETLHKIFAPHIPDIDSFDESKLIAELFRDIIITAAGNKKSPSKKKTTASEETDTAHSILEEKILASGKVVADILGDAIRRIADDSVGDAAEDAEVEDGDETSGAATTGATDTRIQIINNPTVVNQYGEKNIHIDHVDTLKI